VIVKRLIALLGALTVSTCLAAGCASRSPEPLPNETFDEGSGTALIVVRHPIVMARSRTDVAAYARDYVTLVVAQEDRSGKNSTWLVAYRWSTVDTRFDPTRALESGQLLLIGDARSIGLKPAERPPLFLHRADLLFAPHFAVNTWVYAIDRPTLRYLATVRELSLRFPGDKLPEPYSIWKDGRPDLLSLLEGARR
jgi:hypothetical protein